MAAQRTIAVYYEHPDWFRPLFSALERRGIPHVRVDASRHQFDPAASRVASSPDDAGPIASGPEWLHRDGVRHGANGNGRLAARPWSGAGAPLLFNRMSPSAWKRGRAHAILYTLHYLRAIERAGVPVVNGLGAFTVETSKALQLSIIRRLGLRGPRTRVVNHPTMLPTAAVELEFPLVVKPNIGGSGAGITRFETLEALEAAVEQNLVTSSLDGILLLQEFHPPRDRSIVRIETLDGRYLYGIRVHIEDGAGFDLCPADLCRTVNGEVLESAACPAGAAKAGLRVEGYEPPDDVRREVERIARTSRIDVGGIEYLESARDGRRYYYDVNALSNFVADPVRVVGFDPTERLVDYLVARASASAPSVRARGKKRVGHARVTQPVPDVLAGGRS